SKFAKRTWNVLCNQRTLWCRVGPRHVATGSREPSRGRFELTVGLRNTGRKPTVGKAPTVATGAFQRGAGPLPVCRRGGPLRPSRVWSASFQTGGRDSPRLRASDETE